ncbi:MAG TPA: carboxypeptidase-like regulatory domain-containing protein [Dinghuibacter sp.]|uniref:carboxypeptidase-like regulatory domain-containing protein n=1 Tax=Dinghuibacter sp. TaxID=2024697 RepID=UPI002CD6EDA8|nr:carboxypeptidase-like regulatory domain-containing protein [Dinghuibacter sp.]HTJ12817.1 carboxypeptidase-like regulatory domain-containing protein [Dinghuibacter sp.]
MRQWMLYLGLALPLGGLAQASLKNMDRNSHRELVYRIDAGLAEWCIRHDSLPVDGLAGRSTEAVFPADGVHEDRLPPGQYVSVKVVDNQLVTRLILISDLIVYPIGDQRRLQIQVRRRESPDKMISDADVRVDDIKAPYLPELQGYRIPLKHPDKAIVKICIPGDTTFVRLEKTGGNPIRHRFHWRTLKWRLKTGVRRLFHPRHSDKEGVSTVLFSQPKYKPSDTVRVKAYILDYKRRRYQKPLKLILEYTRNGEFKTQDLGVCGHPEPASYTFSFPLSDTLPSGTHYTLAFLDKDKAITEDGFDIEDYNLDEVTDYRFRAEKETVYQGDSIRLLAGASDANGLPILDAQARLVLTRGSVTRFDQDTVYVPDTLYTETIPLKTDEETILGLDTRKLPTVGMTIGAAGTIIDAAGERHDKDLDLVYAPGRKELLVETSGDSLHATYMVNGRSVQGDGYLAAEGSGRGLQPVRYPLVRRIDPWASRYRFYVGQQGHFTDSLDSDPGAYAIDEGPDCRGDTLGFVLTNPRAIPVSFRVMDGETLLDQGFSENKTIRWGHPSPHIHDTYTVAWQYFWKGELQSKTARIWTPYQMLSITLTGRQRVFPGQKDTLHVRVSDAKGRPDAGVDLTAYSYNAQFGTDIRAPQLLYTARYHNNPARLGIHFTGATPGAGWRIPLEKHRSWIRAFGLDTMTYYRMLYSGDSLFSLNTLISTFTPEVSVYAVKNGIPQRIYLLYLNNRLVYYDGVTDPLPYVFELQPAYTKIGLRLYDEYVEVDSVYAQPYYRRDVVIDLDHLPAHAVRRLAPPCYTVEEKELLRNRLWQNRSAYGTYNGYVFQGNRGTRLNGDRYHILGPFDPAGESLRFFAPGFFEIQFRLEPGYQYQLSKDILRLEKMDPLPVVKGVVPLSLPVTTSWVLGDTLPDTPDMSNPIAAPPGPFLELSPGRTNEYHQNGYGRLLLRTRELGARYVVLEPEQNNETRLVLNGTSGVIDNIAPGRYTLLLVDRYFRTAVRRRLDIVANQLLCVHAESIWYGENTFIDRLAEEARLNAMRASLPLTIQTLPREEAKDDDLPKYPDGEATVTGRVVDTHGGLGIVGASVIISGTRTYAVTDKDGYFRLRAVRSGKLTLQVSYIGYEVKKVDAVATAGGQEVVSVRLEARASSLEDVVVVGYGVQKKRSYTGAAVMLEGRVSGLTIDQAPAPPMPSIPTLEAAEGATKMRTRFRDFGFWQPHQLTDKDGRADIAVTYPDNTTRWDNFVVGMDRAKRMGATIGKAASFKPLEATLSLPRFLVEGDSADLVGRVLNYTADPYRVRVSFGQEGQMDTLVGGKTSVVLRDPVTAKMDSLRTRFSLQTGAYEDGEERSVPVFRKGLEETTGAFYLLQGDTTVTFHPEKGGPVTLYVRNNTLDVLLDNLSYLHDYPFFCMEQTSSKLTGLLAEKKINALLGRPFKDDAGIARLTKRLEDNQLYEGGWSWWEKGTADRFITCYVIRALLPLREDPMVANAIRNGLLYLQDELPRLAWRDRLDPLKTMVEAGHVMAYDPYIATIRFDSLDQHDQWAYVRILQVLGRDYREPLRRLMTKGVQDMLGGLHWGEQNWHWYGDDKATTVLAYQVLSADSAGRRFLPSITQYFLRDREYYNTVSSASIVSTVLPDALAAYKDFSKPATISVTGDTSFSITRFPYRTRLSGQGPVTIRKTGGGYTYLTLHQDHWEQHPLPVDSLFAVTTQFIKDGAVTDRLTFGEKVVLHVRVEVKRESEYTMLEIPIPAGCNYSDKHQGFETHWEYLKDRVVIFTPYLYKGVHVYDIPLDVRFSGRYALNPVKVSLMYFPVLYGRNGLEQVTIGR